MLPEYPVRKGYGIWSNFPLGAFSVCCRSGRGRPLTPAALDGANIAACEAQADDLAEDEWRRAGDAVPFVLPVSVAEVGAEIRGLDERSSESYVPATMPGGVLTDALKLPAAEAEAARARVEAARIQAISTWHAVAIRKSSRV